MSVYSDIRRAFETALNAVDGLPTISWENVEFKPVAGQSFLEIRHVPTRRETATRGLNPQHYYQGFFRVDIYCPRGNGPKTSDDIADLIIENFDATDYITGDTVTLSIRYSEKQDSEEQDGWFVSRVNIGYYLYHNA